MYKELLTYIDTSSRAVKQPAYYKLRDLIDYLISDDYRYAMEDSYYIQDCQKSYYDDVLESLKQDKIPTVQSTDYSTSFIQQLYKIDILKTQQSTDYAQWLSKFDHLATSENHIVCNDGAVILSNDLYTNSMINCYSRDNPNYKQLQYFSYLKDAKGLGNLSIASTKYPNVIVINNKKNNKTNFTIDYANSTDDPILESNANIIDIKADTSATISENVLLTSGQLNYVVYIVRENSTLHLNRDTSSSTGWGAFDSVFICHPGSRVTVDSTSAGAHQCHENFFVNLSKDSTFDLVSRNILKKGNHVSNLVSVTSESVNNSCSVDVRNIGDDFTKSNFVGKFIVNRESENFSGTMNNKNLMMYDSAVMHTRPILDIYTKEIQCSHGCTISTVDDELMYYLETRGLSKEQAKNLLVESFLC